MAADFSSPGSFPVTPFQTQTQTQTQTHLFKQDCSKSITTYLSCASSEKRVEEGGREETAGERGGGGGGERKKGEKLQ